MGGARNASVGARGGQERLRLAALLARRQGGVSPCWASPTTSMKTWLVPGPLANRLPSWLILFTGSACAFFGFGTISLAGTKTVAMPY
ncbi:hypothetical protein ZWY2020_028880 [Hordeum vulgare]|nr:hypothetical protein ZWY2020_028880 [Hordeum vulgare]